MIIQLNQYRKDDSAPISEANDMRRMAANAAPQMSVRTMRLEAMRSAGPRLPEQFDCINVRTLIVEAYQLATQI